MCAARATSGALTLLLSVDAKFVNSLKKKTLSILTHTITLLNILATELKSQDIVKDIYNRKWVILNCFFSHRSYIIKNNEPVIKNVFSTSACTSQRSLPQWQCWTQSKTSMSEDFYIRPCIWYVTWNSWSHRQTRLIENSGKRIKLAVVPEW